MSRRSDSSFSDSSTSEKDENHVVQKKSTIVNVVVIVILIALIVSGLIFLLRFSPYYYNIFEKESDVTKELAVNSVRPDHYSLSLTVYLPGYGPKRKSSSFLKKARDCIFEGKVKIDFRVLEPTDTIKLHSLGLKIEEIRLNQNKESDVRLNSQTKDEVNQMLILNFNQTLEVGRYYLEITYSGQLRNDLSGFYKAVYEENGETKIMAATQFEPMSARKMVPCFDEPTAKAKWTVVVTHPVGTVALSNMMEIKTTPVSKELQRTSFKTTPMMSSYILAITVASFKKREARTKGGVLFRVWSRPDEYPKTEFALETGIRVNDEFENYLGVKFPLEKQDMIGVPEFEAGAMENWGLITYKESSLFVQTNVTIGDEKDLDDRKDLVASVVTHELAHQWFGNLVTMKWWDDVWLNEGFARYFEYFKYTKKSVAMADHFLPTQALVLPLDSRAISQPLRRKVDTVQDAKNAFSLITYNKGGSLIWMIKNIMGERKFQAAMRIYLREHAYGNTNQTDLFNVLSKQNSNRPDGKRFDVARFGRMWTTQIGYPLLTVNRSSPTSVMIRQERFRNIPDMPENPIYAEPEDKFKWDVPIWYQVGSSKKTRFTMLPAGKALKVLSRNLIVLNVDSIGCFRVNYDKNTWRDIIKTLKTNPKAYSDETVHRLVSDIFVLAEMGKVDYQTVIDLIESVDLKRELTHKTVNGGLRMLLTHYGTKSEARFIKLYAQKLLHKSPKVKIRRNFSEQKFDKNLVESDIAELKLRNNDFDTPEVQFDYSAEVFKDSQVDYKSILEKVLIEKVPEKKLEQVKLLASSKDLKLLKRVIPIMISSENPVPKKDMPSVFSELCSNEVYQEIMVSELLERWNEVYKYMKTAEKEFNSIIAYSFARVDDMTTLGTMKQFMRDHPETFKFDNFANSIEKAEMKLKWREKFSKSVVELFEKAYKSYDDRH